MAYSLLAEGRSDAEVEQLDIAIGMIDDPAEEAIRELREHQEAMGMTFEDPDAPVAAAGNGDGLPAWMTRDQDLG